MIDNHPLDQDRREYPAESADLGTLACPEYRQGAVALGPFAVEPFDLRPVLCQRSESVWRPRHEIEACATAWLVGALTAHGVELGHHDHLITTLIAHDSWTNVQTVAGWIARAAATAREASASSTDDPQNDTDGLSGL